MTIDRFAQLWLYFAGAILLTLLILERIGVVV